MTVLSAGPHLAIANTANNPQDNEYLDLPLDDLVRVEVPDVYGASKHFQKTTQAPSSVSVVTAREIKLFGHKSLGDILSSIRGFYLTKNRYYDFIGVRGFSRPGDYNSRVLVLLDGTRLNEGVYGGTFMDGALPIDVDMIDRVEVIRGPGSSLYGTGAFFAVINIIPVRGQQLRGLQASGEYGSYASAKGRVTAGTQYESGLDGIVSVSGYESNGTPQVVFPELAGDPTYNNGVVERNHTVRWGNAYAALGYQDFVFKYAESRRANEFGTGIFGNVFNAPSDNYDSLKLFDVQFNHAHTQEDSVFARLSYTYYDYYVDSLYDYPPLTRNYDSSKYEAVSGEVTYKTRIGKRHRITTGAEYTNHFRAHLNNHDIDPYAEYMDVRRSFRTWGLYAQDEWSLSDRLTLNFGARYDEADGSQTSFNPRLGLIATVDADTSIKVLYGSAFRAPNAWESYYESAAIQKASANLRPEKIHIAELVVERSLIPQLFGIASLYHYRVKDLISQITDPADGLIVFQNNNSVWATGLDLELQGKWDWIEGRASYSHQRAVNKTTNQALSNSPQNIAKLTLIAPIWKESLALGLDVQYLGSRTNESSDGTQEEVDGYAVTNMALHHQGAMKGLEISAGVRNLFNKQYGDPSSIDDLPQISAIPRDARTYWLKLTYTFN